MIKIEVRNTAITMGQFSLRWIQSRSWLALSWDHIFPWTSSLNLVHFHIVIGCTTVDLTHMMSAIFTIVHKWLTFSFRPWL